MDKCNCNVRCDVCECAHNLHGRNCSLDCVKITCANGTCTCCDSFRNKND